jgi:hypothetical protein
MVLIKLILKLISFQTNLTESIIRETDEIIRVGITLHHAP